MAPSKSRWKKAGQDIALAELQQEALELRKQGLTYEQIGQRQKCGKRTVQRRVMRALAKMVDEPAADVLKLEIARLDRLWEALEPKIKKGDTFAITAALRVMERRAKLLGLDAPEKVEHTGALSVGPTILVPAERPDSDAASPPPGGLASESGPPN